MDDEVAGNCSHATDFRASSQDSAFFQSFYLFRGHQLCPPPNLDLSCSTTLSTVGLRLKDGTRNTSTKTLLFYTANFGVPSGVLKEILQRAVTSFGRTVGVC
jgi:hypothetical protein